MIRPQINATNDQASSGEELAEVPSVMTTREALVGFYVLQVYISSFPDLAPQHALNLDRIRSAVAAHSLNHTTVRKEIVDLAYCTLDVMIISLCIHLSSL